MARKNPRTNTPEERIDAAGTVSVGCRLPSGLNVNVEVDGEIVTLHFKGSNDRRALALADEQGYHGITSDIPTAHWKAVEEQYATAKWLTSGAVFAAGKRKAVVAEAQELGDRDVGFNALDPEAPANGVEPGDEPV